MKNTNNIESLKQRATYSEDVLNSYLERMKGAYEPYQSFVFASPNELLSGLYDLYKKGYIPCNELMHSLLPPMYYQIWLTKPESIQQQELYEVMQTARLNYQESVEQAKQELFEALVEAEYQEEEAKALAKAEKEAARRKEVIKAKIQREYQ